MNGGNDRLAVRGYWNEGTQWAVAGNSRAGRTRTTRPRIVVGSRRRACQGIPDQKIVHVRVAIVAACRRDKRRIEPCRIGVANKKVECTELSVYAAIHENDIHIERLSAKGHQRGTVLHSGRIDIAVERCIRGIEQVSRSG